MTPVPPLDEKVDESKFVQWIVELRDMDTRERALLELRYIFFIFFIN